MTPFVNTQNSLLTSPSKMCRESGVAPVRDRSTTRAQLRTLSGVFPGRLKVDTLPSLHRRERRERTQNDLTDSSD